MQPIKITSKENSVVKEIKKLISSSKFRSETKQFVIEGLRLLGDATDNSVGFSRFLFTEEALKKHPNDIKKFCLNSENCYILPCSLLNSVSDTSNSQGMMAVAEIPKKVFKTDKNGKYIALENLQDPTNIGAISRTAEALGINGIFVSADSCDIYSPKVLRASMGTLLRMPVLICDDILTQIKERELVSYACVVHGEALKLGTFNFEKGSVCIIGNEGNGLSEKTIAGCDKRVTVPMKGFAESLNAAAAASIVMWEMVSR